MEWLIIGVVLLFVGVVSGLVRQKNDAIRDAKYEEKKRRELEAELILKESRARHAEWEKKEEERLLKKYENP